MHCISANYTHGQDGPALCLSHTNTITIKFKYSYQPHSTGGFKKSPTTDNEGFKLSTMLLTILKKCSLLIQMLNPYFPLDNVQTSHLNGTSYALLSHNSEHTSSHIQYTSNVFLPCVLSCG